MEKMVAITRQGQLNIPKSMLRAFNIHGATRAVVRKEGERIIVEPKKDFWSLSGSLKSKVHLSDRQLRGARETFGRTWPRRSL